MVPQYAIESVVRNHGYKPDDAMILLKPREGERTLRTEDILATIKVRPQPRPPKPGSPGAHVQCVQGDCDCDVQEHGSSTALVLLPGVQYYTGQVFDMAAITKAGHEQVWHIPLLSACDASPATNSPSPSRILVLRCLRVASLATTSPMPLATSRSSCTPGTSTLPAGARTST